MPEKGGLNDIFDLCRFTRSDSDYRELFCSAA
jgi:hypothetical protein